MNENIANKQLKQYSEAKNSMYYTIGGMVYYFLIWILSVLVVRISGYEAAGIFSICMSITSSPAVVALYNMRSFQVSDIHGEYSNKTYVNTRYFCGIASMIFCLVLILIYGYDFNKAIIILAYMVVKVCEGIADAYYGIEQMWMRLDLCGISYILRGVACCVAFTVTLFITDDMFLAMLFMAIAALICVFGIDGTIRKKYEPIYQPQQKTLKGGSPWKLLAICTPLCIVGVLNNFTYTVPKIYLEGFHGSEIMGFYSSVASPTVVVQLIAQTLFLPIIPGLTAIYEKGDKKAFLGRLGKFFGLALGLTVVCLVGAHFLGEVVLVFLYGEGIRPYAYLFVYVIMASVVAAVSAVLMYTCTLMRILIPQCIAGVVGIASSIALSYGMIQHAENPMFATLLTIIIATGAYCIVEIVLIGIKVAKMKKTDKE